MVRAVAYGSLIGATLAAVLLLIRLLVGGSTYHLAWGFPVQWTQFWARYLHLPCRRSLALFCTQVLLSVAVR